MAKAAKVERNKRIKKTNDIYHDRRQELQAREKELKKRIKADPSDQDARRDMFELQIEKQKLPRDASPTRHVNRCQLTGRPHSVYRDFGLSRIMLRMLASFGKLPGVTKSSW
jgi:small subunit ribosomal protein S14